MEPISNQPLAGIALGKVQRWTLSKTSYQHRPKGHWRDAGQIDSLFAGQEAGARRPATKGRRRALSDQFGVQSVAKEMIDAKLAAEHMAEVARMIDFRFGSGTWASILAERQKRIQEAKEARAKARREAQQAHDEMMDTLKTLGVVSAIVLVIIALFMFLFVTAAF